MTNISRVYTGFNGNVAGKLAGTEKFVDELEARTHGALWNQGTWGVRPMRGKTDPSVHGTGRAMDISWRHMGDGRGIIHGRKRAKRWMNMLTENATLLGIEMIIDYDAKPFGRAWRCDRMKWRRYKIPTVTSGGHGDWLHLELNGFISRRPAEVTARFNRAFGIKK